MTVGRPPLLRLFPAALPLAPVRSSLLVPGCTARICITPEQKLQSHFFRETALPFSPLLPQLRSFAISRYELIRGDAFDRQVQQREGPHCGEPLDRFMHLSMCTFLFFLSVVIATIRACRSRSPVLAFRSSPSSVNPNDNGCEGEFCSVGSKLRKRERKEPKSESLCRK